MLDIDTKRRIDTARDILVGKVPGPKSQAACGVKLRRRSPESCGPDQDLREMRGSRSLGPVS